MSKSLSEQDNEAVRAFLRKIIKRFPSQTAAAKSIGVRQPTISDFLQKKRGAGLPFVQKIAAHENVTVDEVLAGKRSRAKSKKVGTPKSDADERYPNRAEAIDVLVRGGANRKRLEVLAPVSGHRIDDLTTRAWIQLLEARLKADELEAQIQDFKPGDLN